MPASVQVLLRVSFSGQADGAVRVMAGVKTLFGLPSGQLLSQLGRPIQDDRQRLIVGSRLGNDGEKSPLG